MKSLSSATTVSSSPVWLLGPKRAMGVEALDALAYRGYVKGAEVMSSSGHSLCSQPLTSVANAGAVRQAAFHLHTEDYRCRAGEAQTSCYTTVENEMNLHCYWTTKWRAARPNPRARPESSAA